jgi:lipopolysaccharide export system ATP-binding protein
MNHVLPINHALPVNDVLPMNHVLEVDSIRLDFGMRSILSDTYLRCETGAITGLLGRNGSGKSCLLRIVYGDLPVSTRSVRFDGLAIAEPYKRPNLLLYLPQFNFIPETLSLQRVLNDYQLEFLELEKKFPEFGATHRSRISELSGGQRRLVNLYIIVRSVSQFVLLDEPFTHLTPLQIEKVKEMLLEEKQHKGLVITDHLYRAVTAVSDQLYILKDGKTYPAKSDRDIETLGYAKL